MKRILLVATLVFQVHSAPLAQYRDFDLLISPDERTIAAGSGAAIEVKITNRSGNRLETGGLDSVNFYFTKCLPCDISCGGHRDVFYAVSPIPSKILDENTSLRFDLDLAALEWRFGPYNRQDNDPPASLYSVPRENIYLFADIRILDGFRASGSGSGRVPRYRIHRSNIISMVIKR